MTERNISRFRWALIGGGVTVLFLVAYCLGYTIDGTGQPILNTLARAQAAIFAIVFSVVILGVRLSATRYSPRLATAFRSDPAYKQTVGIFAISIGFDIAVLYLFNTVTDYHRTVLILLSGGLAIGAFWKLYDFVNETLEKTTPEGILNQIRENLTPELIIGGAYDSAQDATNRDPFLILISVIRSTIEEADRVSASIGLEILGDRISDLFRTAPDDEFEEDTPVDESLENVCVDNLPTVAEEAIEENITQIAIEVTETAETIGETAIEEKLERPLELVVSGQTDLIDNIGYEANEERVRTEVIDVSRGLVQGAVESRLWYSAAIGSRLLGWISAASIMNRDADQRHEGRYTTLLSNGFPKILGTTVDSDDELTEYRTTAWIRRKTEDVDPVDLLVWSCYDSMAELTSAAVRYEVRTGQRLLKWEYVAYGWSEGFNQLIDTDLDSLPRIWFGTILYLSYLAEVTEDAVMTSFDPRAAFEVDNDFASETISMMLEGSLDPTSRINHIPGGTNPLEMPRTGTPVPVVREAEISLEEWLDNKKQGYDNIDSNVGGFGSIYSSSDIDGEDDEE